MYSMHKFNVTKLLNSIVSINGCSNSIFISGAEKITARLYDLFECGHVQHTTCQSLCFNV